jgi:hypothetical protein
LAYFGVIGYEAIVSGRSDMASLAGQLNGLAPLPKRDGAATYDDAVVLDAALSSATRRFFDNTGPTEGAPCVIIPPLAPSSSCCAASKCTAWRRRSAS